MAEPKILVVDDEEIIRISLSMLLEKNGYIVDVAGSSQEALEKVKEDKYQIVLNDIMMPDMDGVELLKKIKEHNSDIYVIMITAYASLENAIGSLKLGASDFIQKPYENSEVIEAVEGGVRAVKEKKAVEGERGIEVKPRVVRNFRELCDESVTKLAEAVEKTTGVETSISIEGPKMEKVGKFPSFVGGESIAIIGSYARLYEGMDGSIALFFPRDDAIQLVEVLTGEEVSWSNFPSKEDGQVFREIGGILSQAYSKKLNERLNMNLRITSLSFVDFVSGNFTSFLELRTGRREEYYFIHKLVFRIGKKKTITGYLLLIFDLKNITLINSSL